MHDNSVLLDRLKSHLHLLGTLENGAYSSEILLLDKLLQMLSSQQIDALREQVAANPVLRQRLENSLARRKEDDGVYFPTSTDQLVADVEYYLGETRAPSVNFYSLLSQFIDREKKKDPEVYRAIGMHRNTWSRIKKRGARTDKRFILRLCFILRLSLAEANYLLALAGYTLIPDDITDLIVRYCLDRKIWNPCVLDSLLVTENQLAVFSEV